MQHHPVLCQANNTKSTCFSIRLVPHITGVSDTGIASEHLRRKAAIQALLGASFRMSTYLGPLCCVLWTMLTFSMAWSEKLQKHHGCCFYSRSIPTCELRHVPVAMKERQVWLDTRLDTRLDTVWDSRGRDAWRTKRPWDASGCSM